MKDKERIERLEELTRELKTRMDFLQRDLQIRYCPKCKRDTIQRDVRPWYISHRYISHRYISHNYECLICGAKLRCRRETVCTIVKGE